jgi:hypothetical protein
MSLNRIVIYLTAVVGFTGGLAPLVADMDWQSTAGILSAVAVILALALKWLTGSQNIEKAQIQVELDARRNTLMQETEAAAIRAAKEAGAAGTRKPTINLPR